MIGKSLQILAVDDDEKKVFGDEAHGYDLKSVEGQICQCDGSLESVMTCMLTTKNAIGILATGESLLAEDAVGLDSNFDRGDKWLARVLKEKGFCAADGLNSLLYHQVIPFVEGD